MPEHAVQALQHAVRIRIVAATLAQLLVTLGLLTMVPALLALGLGNHQLWQRLGLTTAAIWTVGLLLLRLPGVDLRRIDLQWNEALAVTGLAFLLGGGDHGLATRDRRHRHPGRATGGGLGRHHDRAHGAARSGVGRPGPVVPPWLDAVVRGLGIAVLTAALIMRHHAGARRLLETTGERLTGAGARQHARTVFAVYTLLTVLALAALWAAGAQPWDALLHTLSAVSTGGFSPADDSLAGLSASVIGVITVVCLVSAVPLPLYARMSRYGIGVLWRDEEVRLLIAAVLMTTLVLMLLGLLQQGLGWRAALGHGAALSVSAQTDSGFSTTEVAALPPADQLVLMISMTVGGCTGSTAGGLKLMRLLVLLRLVQLALRRTAITGRAVLHGRVDGATLEQDMMTGALQLLTLWLVVLLTSWLVFLLHGQAPMASLFEVVSATANAGLSAGLTGPELAPTLKAVLVADMLFGRVEILALLVLLYPPTWIGRRRKP